MPRLETISPSLAAAFQRASDQKRRRTTLLACEIAVSLSGLHGEAVDTALELVRDGSQEPDVSREIAALSDRLDDEYLRIWDQDDLAEEAKREALSLFHKARAAAALSFALWAESEQLHEALYEAAFTSDDQTRVLKSIEMALQ